MIKISVFSLLVLLLFFSFGSCNKNNPPQNDKPKYRLISEEMFADSSNFMLHKFTYTGNKVSHDEIQDNNVISYVNYTYESDKVLGDVKTHVGSDPEKVSKVEYNFQNNLLIEITSWTKLNDDWINSGKIEFEYDCEDLLQYVEYNISGPYSKGNYQYENNQMVNYTLYYYIDNVWEKWYADEFHYNGNKLVEQYTSMAIVNPGTFTLLWKLEYHYENNSPKQINIYFKENETWLPYYLTDFFYDGNNNLEREEFKYAHDSSLMYYYQYQYEEGESNFDTLRYGVATFDPDLVYPKPFKNLPVNQLHRNLLLSNRR